MNFANNKRVLITGATGFIGSCLVRSLADGTRPVGIFLRSESNPWRISDLVPRLTVLHADLRDYEAVRNGIRTFNPQIVFHLATFGGSSDEWDDGQIIETNILACANLLVALAETDYSAFINAGSSSEYGHKNQPMSENDTPEPMTSYGRSKLTSTLLCRAKASAFGRPIVTLRLFSPYGYYENARRLVPSVILSYLAGVAPKLSAPDSVRDFVFIEDVISAFIAAAKRISDVKSEVINIGSGQQHTVQDVATIISELTGCRLQPKWGAVEQAQYEPALWEADISKAKNLLGWQPQNDLRSGLAKTLDWFHQNQALYTAQE